MPELPEIETIKRGILELKNQIITNTIVRNGNLRYPLTQEIAKKLIGQKILSISRRAKYLVFTLTKGYLVIHLGMSGTLRIINIKDVNEIKKHDHVDIVFSNLALRYNDPRRFGCILYTQDYKSHPIFILLGVEPLTANFNAKYLYNKLQNRTSAIKQLIMDNSIVVGVGNIYASEALFMSRISPLRSGASINYNELEILVKCIKQVLTNAIKKGGSTLRDYRNADGELGYFQNSHLVYNKVGTLCVICNTAIKSIRLGQRNSFYCPSCQK
ncbi:MAG: bifunctional DNA-formamidopyrimidine glycosylase/DNA-(apurinic or apyrimidinic site) lyase [Neisseriaceae bacterium]|jgi:formamidopyrimidine-DNA glycosylase